MNLKKTSLTIEFWEYFRLFRITNFWTLLDTCKSKQRKQLLIKLLKIFELYTFSLINLNQDHLFFKYIFSSSLTVICFKSHGNYHVEITFKKRLTILFLIPIMTTCKLLVLLGFQKLIGNRLGVLGSFSIILLWCQKLKGIRDLGTRSHFLIMSCGLRKNRNVYSFR